VVSIAHNFYADETTNYSASILFQSLLFYLNYIKKVQFVLFFTLPKKISDESEVNLFTFRELSQQGHLLFRYSKLLFLMPISVNFRTTF
jgi:hypothetical protein